MDEVSLQEYVEMRIDALAKDTDHRFQSLEAQIDRRFHANDKTLTAAEDGLNYRLEGMNQFRAQLSDQVSTFATRDLIDDREAAQRAAISKVEDTAALRIERLQATTDARIKRLEDITTERLGRLEVVASNTRVQIMMAGGFVTIALSGVVVATNILLS